MIIIWHISTVILVILIRCFYCLIDCIRLRLWPWKISFLITSKSCLLAMAPYLFSSYLISKSESRKTMFSHLRQLMGPYIYRAVERAAPTLTSLLLLLLLLVRSGDGRPEGSPFSACQSMLPAHGGNQARSDLSPYVVLVSQASYNPGDTVSGKWASLVGRVLREEHFNCMYKNDK